MKNLFSFAIMFLIGTFRSRLYLQLEIAALRHQLSVYQRPNRRLVVDQSDRWLWSFLARFWRDWRTALFFVQPRTVIQWQRQRFRAYWRGLSCRSCRGRPAIPLELRRLIRRMWQANPTWGSPRIVAELHLLEPVSKVIVSFHRVAAEGRQGRWRRAMRRIAQGQ